MHEAHGHAEVGHCRANCSPKKIRAMSSASMLDGAGREKAWPMYRWGCPVSRGTGCGQALSPRGTERQPAKSIVGSSHLTSADCRDRTKNEGETGDRELQTFHVKRVEPALESIEDSARVLRLRRCPSVREPQG